MGFVLYLVSAELLIIHAICLWCTAVHVITFILFVLIVTGWDEAHAGHEVYDESDPEMDVAPA